MSVRFHKLISSFQSSRPRELPAGQVAAFFEYNHVIVRIKNHSLPDGATKFFRIQRDFVVEYQASNIKYMY